MNIREIFTIFKMSGTVERKSGNQFRDFISKPNKILWLISTVLAAVLAIANGLPWFDLECFLVEKRERYKNECEQRRLELNTAVILLLLSILSLSNLVERYGIFSDLRKNSDTLEKMIREASFKQQITPVRGSKEWYETAYRIIAEANPKGYIYDASLSSPTWNINRENPEKQKFVQIREEAFKDKEKDTRYLFTIKSYLEEERFQEYLEELRKDGTKEYELQLYKQKLALDIDRVEIVSKRLEQADIYPNHSAAYLPEIKLQHPILSFLIVDGQKVLLGFYRSEYQESEINKDGALLIDNKEIATLFTEYFDFLWKRASVELAHDSGKTGQLKKISDHLEEQLRALKHI